MSISLLKRSIAIVEEDLPTNKKQKKQDQKSVGQTKQSLVDLIPEKQKLYGKYKNRRGHQVRYEKLQQPEKLSVSDVRQQTDLKKSKVADNLQKLLRLGSSKMNPKITEKLLGHVKRRQRLKNEVEDDDKAKEEVSIFTEEDFKAFEKEYFNS